MPAPNELEFDDRLELRLRSSEKDELRRLAEANGETLSERARAIIMRGLARASQVDTLERDGFVVVDVDED